MISVRRGRAPRVSTSARSCDRAARIFRRNISERLTGHATPTGDRAPAQAIASTPAIPSHDGEGARRSEAAELDR